MEGGPPDQNYAMPAPQDDEYSEIGWRPAKFGEKISAFNFPRTKVTDNMVKYEMLYAGICHTDIHFADGGFGPQKFPMVPGHELLGKVTEVGSKVTKAKVGDIVAVGCLVDSCLDCKMCKSDDEQMCDKGNSMTYGAERKHGRIGGNLSLPTYGGYSGSHVCHEHFIVNIPEGMDLEKTAPILCAGITMYDPLRHWGFLGDCKGKTVGIVGVGGLGTMGIKIAKAQGHTVVAISRGTKKAEMAKVKGASHTVDSTDPASIEASPKCDIILNTVSANHDLNVYLPLLAKNGNLVQIGAAPAPHAIS
jgi:alcohol dehydrogenase (NADP+)